MQGRIFCRTYDMIKSRCFLDSDETKKHRDFSQGLPNDIIFAKIMLNF